MLQLGICTVERQSTSTPLQALVLLNDPQFVESSKILAANILNSEKEVVSQITKIFRLSTSRAPNEKELKQLNQFYKEQLTHFKKSPKQANELLATGEYQLPNPPKDKLDWAALTMVASAVFNLDESIIR
jgi:hypothetical protein